MVMALREIWDGWIGRINLVRSRAKAQVGGPIFRQIYNGGGISIRKPGHVTQYSGGGGEGKGEGKVPEAPDCVRERLWGGVSLL